MYRIMNFKQPKPWNAILQTNQHQGMEECWKMFLKKQSICWEAASYNTCTYSSSKEWIENLHCKCVRSVFGETSSHRRFSMPLIQGLAHLRTWSLRPCMVPRAYEHGEGITHATTWSSWSSWSSNTYNITESHWNWQNVIEWHLKTNSLIAGHCWGRLNFVVSMWIKLDQMEHGDLPVACNIPVATYEDVPMSSYVTVFRNAYRLERGC